MNELEKIILISKIEDSGTKIAVFDENNKKFTFFKEWEGQNTDGYNSFLLQKVAAGSTVKIVYVEKQGEYLGKPVTYRNIYRFEVATQAQVAAKPPFVTPSEVAKKETDRTDGMIRHGVVCAYLGAGKVMSPEMVSYIEAVLIPYIKTGVFTSEPQSIMKAQFSGDYVDASEVPF